MKESKDYLNDIILDIMIFQKLSFWAIKEYLKEKNLDIDKKSLFNRIKKIIKNKK